ncbi:toll/interleukin-1 receptor domain-containing protein [Nocardioides salarius]|uniref:toll/interleukin-1 receptor domain-containing protein n=1 Tax=Nocardioides salarius TaxID=374513 RepID=UPI0030F9B505
MAYYTVAQAREAARRAGGTSTYSADATLRKESKNWRTSFDVFLSHAYLDAQEILGVKALLEAMSLIVYVDWIDDRELDRTKVTSATAEKLRQRMRQSKSMIFATSRAAVDSKWMPWELGYFDGFRPGHIAVLPLVSAQSDSFDGQEYVGLYPRIEQLRPSTGYAPEPVVTRGLWQTESKSLHSFVAGTGSFSKTAYR